MNFNNKNSACGLTSSERLQLTRENEIDKQKMWTKKMSTSIYEFYSLKLIKIFSNIMEYNP